MYMEQELWFLRACLEARNCINYIAMAIPKFEHKEFMLQTYPGIDW